MVKLNFGFIKSNPLKLNIDNKISIEEITQILQKDHNFQNGLFQFIFNGKILTNPTPFENLKDDSRIIIRIIEKETKVPKEYLPILELFFDSFQIPQLFNESNSFYLHHNLLNQIQNIINNNSSNLITFSYHEINHYSMEGAIQSRIFDHNLEIIGIDRWALLPCVDNLSVELDLLSDKQRNIFLELSKNNSNHLELLNNLKKNNFNL